MEKLFQIKFNLHYPRAIFCLSLVFFHTHVSICSALPLLGTNGVKSSDIGASLRRVCSQTVGDCSAEAAMESESSRRILLEQKKYISYETLRRDMVPCRTPGASYYNCYSGAVNHYNRGCEVITWCARNIKDDHT